MSDVAARLSAALSDRYALERELGEGGMATVYLAHDVKHNRDVAIKVLKPELAAILGAERFLAEIETTAQLQHPHILPLFDSGEADGFLYYVMPYVEGESLQDRLDRERQLPVDEAVRIGVEVADALDYAHRQGVVHRDIKPANILLHEGRVMVADFGIALAVREAGGSRLTETGLSLGTPHYMSPEQATADQAIDARSDVYSLGAMVYEMLAGRPPHVGTSVQAVIASVLTKAPPPVDEDRPSVPADLAAVVHRSIERLPADRFQSAAELGEALKHPAAYRSPTGARAAAGRDARWKERAAWASGALLVAIATWAFVGGMGSEGGAAEGVIRFRIPVEFASNGPGATDHVADITPDGRRIVFWAPRPPRGFSGLYARDLDALDVTPVPHQEEGVAAPEVSPDGDAVFVSAGPLGGRVFSLDRGTTVASWDLVVTGGAHWAEDGYIYLSNVEGIYRVPGEGGEAEWILRVPAEEGARSPFSSYRLPEGRGILYHALSFSASIADLYVYDMMSESSRLLLNGGTSPQYLPLGRTGVLLFQTPEGTLEGVEFDARAMEIVGEPRRLLDDIAWDPEFGRAYGISDDGVLVYQQVAPSGREPVWVTRDGMASLAAPSLPAEIEDAAISPDGSRIAVQARVDGSAEVIVYDTEQGTQTRLTTGGGENWRPSWLPGGERVAFVSDRDGVRALYTRPVDGSGPAELLVMRDRLVQQVTWREDETFVFREGFSDALTMRDLLRGTLGDTVFTPFVASEFDEFAPAFSPDGSWVAYVSDEAGRDDVYLRPFPGPGGRVAITPDGGTEPAWAPDGSAVYFRSRADSLVEVTVDLSDRVRVADRTALFPVGRYLEDRNDRVYDVHPDGERFLFIRQPETTNLVVVMNWFDELRGIFEVEGR